MNTKQDITPLVRSWLKEPASLPQTGTLRVAQLVHEAPQQHGWLPTLTAARFRIMFTATKFVTAGAMVALMGGLLLINLPSDQQPAPVVPAAESASPAPSSEPTMLDTDLGEETQAGQPGWPGVDFELLDRVCEDERECPWDEPGTWNVESDVHGEFTGASAMAIGPTGPPWLWSHSACGDHYAGESHPCVWQMGVPGYSVFPPESPLIGDARDVMDLAVTPDGRLWAASTLGLHSFDGDQWTEHWTGSTVADLAIAPDGSILAVGGGLWWGLDDRRSSDKIIVLSGDEGGIASLDVDVIPAGHHPTAIAALPDGTLWVSAIGNPYTAVAPGENSLARFDGETWQSVRPLGDEHDAAAWDLATGSDGSLWVPLWTYSEGDGLRPWLARFDGREWTTYAPEGIAPLDIGFSLEVDAAGTAWFTTWDPRDGTSRGIVSFDGQTWSRHLDDAEFELLHTASDGTVWAVGTFNPGDQERIIAIRP